MALNTFWTQPPTVPPQPRRRRWQLLIADALDFYRRTPGGATAIMVADYVRPRLGWFGRTFGCTAKVYAVLYAMVDMGWVEHIRGEAVGEHGGVRYTYRIVKGPQPLIYDKWREIDKHLVGDDDGK